MQIRANERKLEDSRNAEGLNLLTIKGVAKMRKDKMQQKNQGNKQLKLFEPVVRPDVKPSSGTGRDNMTGAELSSRLEQQLSLTVDILERIVDFYRYVVPCVKSRLNYIPSSSTIDL